MQRRLIVMRHAKSAWDNPGLADHDRPLNDRGRKDAPNIARHLADEGWLAEKIVSSSSRRTRETWALMAPSFPPKVEVDFTRNLFHAGPSEVQKTIASQQDATASLMILGHNPGWEDVVSWLCGHYVPMGTANAALLSISADTWTQALARAGHWTLHDVVRPKDF